MNTQPYAKAEERFLAPSLVSAYSVSYHRPPNRPIMFRRRWPGLPADPVFATNFKELGYFINDIDEIRSIEEPDYYFKYFLTKNNRWNERQRFAFNEAVTKEIHARLSALGYTTIRLPLGTPATQPHVPIRASADLPTADRVVLLVGEPYQSLGVLAHRVICGRGGVARGSVVGLVEALTATSTTTTADSAGGGVGDGADEGKKVPPAPAVVLANPGELWWWPEGGRGLTQLERHGVPMASAVHNGRWHDEKVNEIPGHRSVAEHVKAVFEGVVMGGWGMMSEKAKVDVIAVGEAADVVEAYLNDDAVWEKVEGTLGCLVVLGGFYSADQFKCDGFKRFMRERGRAYVMHHTPLDTPVAGPDGNPGAAGLTTYGCPVYSAGKANVTETMLIEAQPAVVNWIRQVAREGDAYKNEEFEIFGEEGNGITTEEPDAPWGDEETSVDEKNEAANAKAGAGNTMSTSDNAERQVQVSAEGEDKNAKSGIQAVATAEEGGKDETNNTEDSVDKSELSRDSNKSMAEVVVDLVKGAKDLVIGK